MENKNLYLVFFAVTATILLSSFAVNSLAESITDSDKPIVENNTKSLNSYSLRDSLNYALNYRETNSYSADGEYGGDKPSDEVQFQSSTWLAASPSLAVGYLKSQEPEGADEAEIGLNLSIKSNAQRNIDNQLDKLDKDIRKYQNLRQKLTLSGLIRESVWGHKLAEIDKRFAEKTLVILTKLESNNQIMVNAGESSDYLQLLIKKERINANIAILETEKQIKRWQLQYQEVTGEVQMPTKIAESEPVISAQSIALHPQIVLHQKFWQQVALNMKSESNESDPWGISVTAKNIDNQGFQDNQVGISFEMPLSFIDANSQKLKNDWLQQKKGYENEHRNLQLVLNQNLSNIQEERKYLTRRNGMLKESVALTKQIMKQVEQMKSQNEMGQEFILRRVLDAIDIQKKQAITQLEIQQNNSLTRQVLGITL